MAARTPSLSLCLIVRDEAALIEDCIASAAGLIDELIVVDTGSVDDTVERVRALGAKVIHFEWIDDFAAARNVSLDAATGTFVLVLDADERLQDGAADVIQALMSQDEPSTPTVYLPLISNVDRAGNPMGADHMPRLWRRRPELRFSGRIHEELGADLPHLRRVIDDRFRILHLGYDPELAKHRGKRARNVALLERELAARPDDPRVWFYLAKERYAAGEDQAAFEGFERVTKDGTILNFSLSSRVFGAECLRALDQPEAALKFAIAGLQGQPDYGELYYVAGMAAAQCPTRGAQAEALLAKAVRVPKGLAATAFRDPSISRWRAERERARLLFARGALEDGVALLDSVIGVIPADARVEAELQLADALLALGQEDRAWEVLEPLLDSAPEDATPTLLQLINLYVGVLGLEAAYRFVDECLVHHLSLLHQVPVVGAAAELAEAIGLEDKHLDYLQICANLSSPHPEHYLALAKLRMGRGEHQAAESALKAARACMAQGG